MSQVCSECDRMVPDGARFCRYCGAKLRQTVPAPARLPAGATDHLPSAHYRPLTVGGDGGLVVSPDRSGAPAAAEPAESQRACPQCGITLSAQSRFCRQCGADLSANLMLETTVVMQCSPPMRRVVLPSPVRAVGRRAPYGSLIAGAGAVVVLAACFLPLFGGAGNNMAIIPTFVSLTRLVLLIPLSALAVGLLAGSAPWVPWRARVMFSGAALALTSPGLLLALSTMLSMARMTALLHDLLPANALQPGAGLIMLCAGYAIALAGGFVMLSDAHSAKR